MATYYVNAGSGNNGNPGTIGSPWATMAYAIAQLTPGDTLYIRNPGFFQGEIISAAYLTASGTAGSPIIISGYPGETVTFEDGGSGAPLSFNFSGRQYIEIQDLVFNGLNGTTSGGCGLQDNNITLRRVTISNWWLDGIFTGGNNNQYLDCIVKSNGRYTGSPGTQGVYMYGDNNLIRGGDYFDNGGDAIRIYDSAADPARGTGNIVELVRIRQNGYGIGLGGTSDSFYGGGGISIGDSDNTVRNCLIYGNHYGINLTGSVSKVSQRIKLYNNTLSTNVVGITSGASYTNDTEIINNILRNTTDISLGAGTHTNKVETTNRTDDPLFTNAGAFDFTLQAGSPAINAGTHLPSVPKDFTDVTVRSNPPDVGAYERPGGTPPGRGIGGGLVGAPILCGRLAA